MLACWRRLEGCQSKSSWDWWGSSGSDTCREGQNISHRSNCYGADWEERRGDQEGLACDGWMSTSPGQPNPNLWQSVTTGSCPKSTKTMHKEVCLFFFTPWSYTRQHHHTTTHPGVFHTQTRWPPLSAVTAMVSSQPGASQRTFVWPGHPAALAPGLLGVGLAIQPFFDSLLASETGPYATAWVLSYALKLGKENEEVSAYVCVCVCVHVCVHSLASINSCITSLYIATGTQTLQCLLPQCAYFTVLWYIFVHMHAVQQEMLFQLNICTCHVTSHLQNMLPQNLTLFSSPLWSKVDHIKGCKYLSSLHNHTAVWWNIYSTCNTTWISRVPYRYIQYDSQITGHVSPPSSTWLRTL